MRRKSFITSEHDFRALLAGGFSRAFGRARTKDSSRANYARDVKPEWPAYNDTVSHAHGSISVRAVHSTDARFDVKAKFSLRSRWP